MKEGLQERECAGGIYGHRACCALQRQAKERPWHIPVKKKIDGERRSWIVWWR